ncbi:3-keto-5-aminohexanoate cleavage protein [Paraburkholderia phytofirmans]|uniref:3-keto-5-aminohexanoate cleavage protein n=1 Tax=Paraburkholderia sp. BL9I2N2 TaxID=1938809 RepID=UPI00105123B3|nr:3-keto-5-aminohexanoate cleavage protein [Paraburkholderia sp. BL9I2N2]TCK88662.1 3-keto-5-aminohexanoate cleavage enzyme [Paraburkholderia sp. BL9I2N2]
MNSLCIVNTSIPYFRDGDSDSKQSSTAEFVEILKASIEHGASVLDIGAVAHALQNSGGVEELRLVINEIRASFPEVIFQVACRNLFELNRLLTHFDALDPDIVSVPVAIFCNSEAIGLLRSREDHLRKLRGKLSLDIEDLSMVFRAVKLQHDGLLDGRLRVNFCLGREFGVPSDRDAFLFFVETLRRLAPEATWTGVGRGKSELELARWSIEMGGHGKATVTQAQGSISTSGKRDNATLYKVIHLCKENGRRPASFAEARHILSLRTAFQRSFA